MRMIETSRDRMMIAEAVVDGDISEDEALNMTDNPAELLRIIKIRKSMRYAMRSFLMISQYEKTREAQSYYEYSRLYAEDIKRSYIRNLKALDDLRAQAREYLSNDVWNTYGMELEFIEEIHGRVTKEDEDAAMDMMIEDMEKEKARLAELNRSIDLTKTQICRLRELMKDKSEKAELMRAKAAKELSAARAMGVASYFQALSEIMDALADALEG